MSRSVPWAPSSRTWSPRRRASWTSHVTSARCGAEPLAPGERLLDEGLDLELLARPESREQGFFSGRTRASFVRTQRASSRSSSRRPVRAARSS